MKTFAAIVVSSLILDMLWIGLIAKNFYRNQIGSLMRLKEDGSFDVLWPAAVLVYILIPCGIYFFVLPKASEGQSLASILPWGFFFGIILYGVYDFTNYSLLRGWTLPMTLVDCLWGGILCAVASCVALYVSRIT